MTDKKNGFIAGVMKGFLWAASVVYGLFIRIIRYARTRTAKGISCKVISVGNMTLGGTGKTPTACMLAKLLKSRGKSPCILIRGYGDDEWKMLENSLDDIPVIVGPDRVATGRKACSEYGADTVILDDGFQHWGLKRDLNIVLLDSTNPFGNRSLFPRGVLRETEDVLSRADIIVLTKVDMGKGNLEVLKKELREGFGDIPVLQSVHAPVALYELDNTDRHCEAGEASRSNLGPRLLRRFAPRNDGIPLSQLNGLDICALSSVANAGYFEYTLKSLGANIKRSFRYPDHYDYKEADLDHVLKQSTGLKVNTIVTTEKDAVKLSAITDGKSGVRILVLQIEARITDGEEVLHKRLHCLYRG